LQNWMGAAGQNGSVEYFGLSRFTHFNFTRNAAASEASLICPRLRRFNRCLTFPSTQPAKLLSSVLARRCRRENLTIDVLAVCPGPTETNFSKKLNFPTVSSAACEHIYSHRGGGARSPPSLGKKVYSRPWWCCESIDSEFTPVLP